MGISALITTTADGIALLFGDERPSQPSTPDFEARLRRITAELNRSGSNAQMLLTELQDVISARTQAVADASASILSLQLEESELEERVSRLKAIEPESAKIFNQMLESSMSERDRRSSRRDLILFALGAMFSGALWVISEFFLR